MRTIRWIIILILLEATMHDVRATEPRDFDAKWDYGKPADTEAVFRDMLADAHDTKDAAYVAELLTQIARTLGLQQRFTEAHATLDEALAGIESEDGVPFVRYLLERGRAFNSSDEREQATPLFEDAWRIASEKGYDFYAVDAAHMMEIVSAPENKLDWNEKACRVAEASDSPRAKGWLGSLYNNRGWSLHELERYEEALAVFEKRLAWLTANRPDTTQLNVTHWSIAKTLRLLDRPEEALEKQRALLEKEPEDGYVYEEIGECLLALGRPRDAAPYFREAHARLSTDPWLERNEAERLARLKELGAEAN